MGLFKKKITFTSAKCPECNGNLELDSNFKVAYCKNCGAQCIIENVKNKQQKQSGFKTLLDFVERQQSIIRQDKQEEKKQLILQEEQRQKEEFELEVQRKKEKEIKKQKRSEHFKKWWKVYLIIGITIVVLSIIIEILEKQGLM